MSRLTVIGDSLWDVEVRGAATRLAPDAPVPVLEDIVRTERPGGAALAATMAARDGHDVTLITWLAADEHATALRRRLLLEGVEVVAVPLSSGSTPVKMRIGTHDRVLVRVDEGCEPHVGQPMRTAAVNSWVSRSDAVLVSDYGRGITGDPMLRLTLRSTTVPVVWDPHPRGTHPVSGATVVTPNRAEAGAACDEEHRLASPALQARHLRTAWTCAAVALTAGADGVWFADGDEHHVPTRALAGVDTCGAGDRFATALAGAVAAGHPTLAAVEIAAQAATGFVADGAAGTLSTPPGRPVGNAAVGVYGSTS